MKHKLMLLMSVLLVIGLMGACSSTEGSKIADIYSKSTAASKDLNSFSMKADSVQWVRMGDMESKKTVNGKEIPGGLPMQTTIDADIQIDPAAFHQHVTSMGQTTEQYYTEDGFYMSSPGNEKWMKAPKEYLDQLNQLAEAQKTPAQQLEKLQDYVDEFDLDQKDGQYILSFHSEGENVKDLLKDTMKETFPEGKLPKDLLDNVTIKNVDYTFKIDKESYYPTAIDMEMNFTIDDQGKKTHIKQTLNGIYSDYNQIGEISVPDKIQKSAKELPDMQSLLDQ